MNLDSEEQNIFCVQVTSVDAGCFIIVSVQVTVSLNELGELHEKWECNEKLCTSPLELRRHVIMLNSRNGNWFIVLPIALSSYRSFFLSTTLPHW
jgi:hypothetical protein